MPKLRANVKKFTQDICKIVGHEYVDGYTSRYGICTRCHTANFFGSSKPLQWLPPIIRRDNLPKNAIEGTVVYDIETNSSLAYDGTQWLKIA